LEQNGLDPDAVIGGRLRAFGSSARLGRGEYMVAEADESDRSFLMLWPSIAVLTNIDNEHMESYGSFDDLQGAFAEFANKVPFYGSVIARDGTRPAAHLAGIAVDLGAFGARCRVHRWREGEQESLGVLELSVPGRHNLQNALATVAVACELGLDFAQTASALRVFEGAERRFERHGESGGVLVVDDYAHHPTEIAAVLAAARATLGRRLVVAFQPHRYSRTHRLMDAFGPAFREADEIVLTDIYAAGEDPIPGVTLEAVADAVRRGSGRPVRTVARVDDLVPAVVALVRTGDAVVTLGAGSIGTLPKRLLEALAHREATI
jgi:UDP-N-acetylmuramate--alanine ligase